MFSNELIVTFAVACLVSFIAGLSTSRKQPIGEGKQPFVERDAVDIEKEALLHAKGSTCWSTPILNESEQEIYQRLRAAIEAEFGSGSFPVLCQVPLKACIAMQGRKTRTQRTILAKLPDFLVVSYAYKPIIAIEYNGPGHRDRGDELTALSDATKATVLTKAGIKLIAITEHDDLNQRIADIVEELSAFKAEGSASYKARILLSSAA